jgi:hypothetical protein
MNSLCSLPIPESITEHGADKNDQWQGYRTMFFVHHSVRKLNCILTAVIVSKTQLDRDKSWDPFFQEVKWTISVH